MAVNILGGRYSYLTQRVIDSTWNDKKSKDIDTAI